VLWVVRGDGGLHGSWQRPFEHFHLWLPGARNADATIERRRARHTRENVPVNQIVGGVSGLKVPCAPK